MNNKSIDNDFYAIAPDMLSTISGGKLSQVEAERKLAGIESCITNAPTASPGAELVAEVGGCFGAVLDGYRKYR